MHHGLVLLFDQPVNSEAISLSQAYRSMAEDQDFVLGYDRNIPHVSLLHLEFDPDGSSPKGSALRKMREAMDEAVGVLKGSLLWGSFSAIRAFDTWCWWQTPFTPELLALHNAVVDRCAPLRTQALIDYPESMSEAQSRMYERYGCWFVKDAWNPHMTLQVLRPEFSGFAREHYQQWYANSLALARMGQFGSVQDVIHRVPIGK